MSLEITKENDIGRHPQQIVALEFNERGLTKLRPAERLEFIELESGKAPSFRQQVLDYVLLTGTATATQVAQSTGLSRENVSRLFNHDPAFKLITQVGRDKLYGVLAKGPA